jgi:5-formyltetrahydrofolate cyclo-ligase
MSAADAKAGLRRRLRAEVAGLPAPVLSADSAAICASLRSQPVWKEARAILFFSPLPDEPDIWPLVTEALALHRKVVLPRYLPTENRYVLHTIHEGPRALEPGQFGVLEPMLACPEADPKQLDLALVPGIGFTLAGGRLGRGKGYFDRLLAEIPAFKCGVAFDCQVIAELPLEPHDVRLNCILTPTRWHLVGGQPRS